MNGRPSTELQRLSMLGKIKPAPVCRQLSAIVGGSWKYNRTEENWTSLAHPGKHVARVHMGGYDYNSRPLGVATYMLYDTVNNTTEELLIRPPGKPWHWKL